MIILLKNSSEIHIIQPSEIAFDRFEQILWSLNSLRTVNVKCKKHSIEGRQGYQGSSNLKINLCVEPNSGCAN